MHMNWWLSTRNWSADLRIVATQREPCGHTLYHFSLSQNRVPSCGLCRCLKWWRNQGVQGQPFSHCQILLVMYALPLQYILVSGCLLLQWCSHEVFHFKSCWENVLRKHCTCQRWCEKITVEIEHSISDLDHGRVGSWVHRNRSFWILWTRHYICKWQPFLRCWSCSAFSNFLMAFTLTSITGVTGTAMIASLNWHGNILIH